MHANVLELLQVQARDFGIFRAAAQQPAVVLDGRHERQHRHGDVPHDELLRSLERLFALVPGDVRVRPGPAALAHDLVLPVGGQRLRRVEDFHRDWFY